MVKDSLLSGVVIEESTIISLTELCHVFGKPSDWVLALVDEGIIEPVREEDQLQFSGRCLSRVRIVQRLESDLGVNLAGAALAIELLEQLEDLNRRLTIYE